MDKNTGIIINTNTVAKAKPKAIETAIGIKNCACNDVSNNSGVRPAIVVKDVNNTALKRCTEASVKASLTNIPLSRRRL